MGALRASPGCRSTCTCRCRSTTRRGGCATRTQARVTEIWTYRPAAEGFDLVRMFHDSGSSSVTRERRRLSPRRRRHPKPVRRQARTPSPSALKPSAQASRAAQAKPPRRSSRPRSQRRPPSPQRRRKPPAPTPKPPRPRSRAPASRRAGSRQGGEAGRAEDCHEAGGECRQACAKSAKPARRRKSQRAEQISRSKR